MTDMRLNIRVILVDRVRILLIENLHTEFDIRQQLIASALGEILSDNHAQHLQILRVRGHRISRDDPAALTKLMRERELVVVFLARFEAEGDEGETFAVLLRHDDEA
jgi:hypothetical protein